LEWRVSPILTYFLVCTPRELADELQSEAYVFGRNYLGVPRYDYALIYRAITELCERAQGSDWDTVAQYLARYGQ
jgi:hypothetical protein